MSSEKVFAALAFALPVFLVLSLGWPLLARADAPDQRYRIDSDDVAHMKAKHPQAAESLERGEGLLAAGNAKLAAELFGQAAKEAPDSALAARRQCQALTELGQRNEAVAACRKARENRGSSMDLRALVGAMMSSESPLSVDDVTDAVVAAKEARDLMMGDPWGYAAFCDIAARLGDTAMFQENLEAMKHLAPEHYETRRATAMASTFRGAWRVTLGWLFLAATCAGTLVHALSRSRRTLRMATTGTAAILVLASFAAWPRPAFADAPTEALDPQATDEIDGIGGTGPHATKASLSQWAIDDEDPIKSLPTPKQRDSNPLEFGYHLMDLSDHALHALKRKDPAQAAKYYEAIAKAVPDRAIGFAKACETFEAAGNWEKAVEYCKEALYLGGVRTIDYARYVRLMVAKRTPLEADEVDNLDQVIDHLKKEDPDHALADDLACDVGVRLHDKGRLEQCTAALSTTAENDPKTISYQWALALLRKDFAEADRLIARAKTTDMTPDRIRRMEETTVAALPSWRRALRNWRVVATLAIVLSAAAALLVVQRRSDVRAAA